MDKVVKTRRGGPRTFDRDEAIDIAVRAKNNREQSRARARGEGSSLAAMAPFARNHADWLEPTLRACIKSGQPHHLRLALQQHRPALQ